MREEGKNLPLLGRVDKAVPGVKHGQVVDILHVALAEVGGDVEALAQKVQRVQGLGLGLRDGRHVGAARQRPEPDERAARVLQQHPLGHRRAVRRAGGLVVEEGAEEEAVFVELVEALNRCPFVSHADRIVSSYATPRPRPYFSTGQSSASVRTRSGLVRASSLYTRHVLASLLAPPRAASPSANKDTTSPESVWKTCLSAV